MIRGAIALAACLLCLAAPMRADPMLITDFSQPGAGEDWRFFTDQVMGGESTGQATIADGALTLTGTVSTANRGGFIQVRSDRIALPSGATGIRLRIRGDGQLYYLHLRTRATRLPWQYYQAGFTAPPDWAEVTVPLADFRPSGRLLPQRPSAGTVHSVALVAYGRDHAARVSLARIEAD